MNASPAGWWGFKAWAAIAIALAALAIWGKNLWPRSAPSEQALRDTTGIEVTALNAHRAERGYRVQCRVVNHRQQLAEQVVFQVALVQANGRVLAVNPLAGASAIPPGETREIHVFVPAAPQATSVRARAEALLVRWKD